jgi:hypothetical protein
MYVALVLKRSGSDHLVEMVVQLGKRRQDGTIELARRRRCLDEAWCQSRGEH